jgi:hypothetical protein
MDRPPRRDRDAALTLVTAASGSTRPAGHPEPASRVAAAVAAIWPSHPRVVPTGVPGEPVLRGAMLAAVDQARAALLASVADPAPSGPGRFRAVARPPLGDGIV